MKKLALLSAVALTVGIFAGSAYAADPLKLQLKWSADAQFAGYYVALAKGFYKDANLDVTILPGGPNIAPEQVIAGGGADVIVDWMAAALVAREKGVALVNIAQPFKNGGLQLTCWKSSGVKSPADLKGKTVGVWFYGNEYPFFAFMSKNGIQATGDNADVKVLQQAFNVDPLLQHQADCISTMSYNEYWQVLESGVKADDLVVFKYSDQGAAMLEDGLYTTEDKLKDPATADKLARFVKASMQGWDYAQKNPAEAVKIVEDNDPTGAISDEHETHMMAEINKLTAGTNGALDPAAYKTTVDMLLSQKIITAEPTGASTTAVTDAAGLK
jgi:NitT/TauT family transport system substrate-binding protein